MRRWSMLRQTLCGIFLVVWAPLAFSQTLIPKEAIFKGKFVGRDVTIDGEFEGSIATDFSMEITEDGVVKGTVETTDAIIGGIMEGTVLAVGALTLTEMAEVRGTIQCRDITVATGAIVSARVLMGEEKTIGTGTEKKKTTTPKASGRRRRGRRRRR
jgi:cytoskeletal protein CcmA (bactofilin family)